MAVATVMAALVPGISLQLVARASTAGEPGRDDLVVAGGGTSAAVVAVAPEAGLPVSEDPDGRPVRGRERGGRRNHEWLAAEDLVAYIGLMTGAEPRLVFTRTEIDAALKGSAPVILVGEEALRALPDWARRVRAAAKPDPMLQSHAIGLLRKGHRVFVAGNNDASHYFAAAELLWRWGCRWYLPAEFGECIPEVDTLRVGTLDFTYGSPFEIRGYGIYWRGDATGRAEFARRNMMTLSSGGFPPTSHALGKYTRDAPAAKGTYNFPITAHETARHVAEKIEEAYSKGKGITLSMEDGAYDSDDPADRELMELQWDKYFMRWSVTDPMLELYNNIARILREKHPDSGGRLGFLAYLNMTIPPVRDMRAEPALFCKLAPIDIDPIHGMDDMDSPPRREYRDMMYAWAKVMQGRLAIYDYDQGMLVWRDIPNPSHPAFRQDVQHYRKAGILGIRTESRNAIGTTFLNLFLRGRLMWNPNEDIDALLKEFYPKFYGPAAEPMAKYWSKIYDAWDDTIVTEHEYFVAPAIYTPRVIETCRQSLEAAEEAVSRLAHKQHPTRRERQVLDRMRFTRLSFEIMDGYLGMVRQAATHCNYAEAAKIGEKTLTFREAMTDMNGTFTTYRRIGEKGAAWWPGEVAQYAGLATLLDGTKGTLIAKLPLDWAFRRDKQRVGGARGYATRGIDLSCWNATRDRYTLRSLKTYPDEWEMLRTDLYAQAQGVRDPDGQSFTGDLWYRTDVELTAAQTKGHVRLMFPGLFNECHLYVNGEEVAHRKQRALWWRNNYAFEWDVDLAGKLKPGRNTLALRANCEHHFGGMFRRPFLYLRTE